MRTSSSVDRHSNTLHAARRSPVVDPGILTPGELGLPIDKFPSFRPGQESTILDLAASPRRFRLLSAPTGSGKSLLYISLSLLQGSRTLVLVTTKALQDQLVTDFGDCGCGMFDIRGHSNYPCAVRGVDDDSPFECSAGRDSCPYWHDVEEARNATIVPTTYAHWISLFKAGDPGRLGTFDHVVIDEGHLAHDTLVSHIGVEIKPAAVERLIDIHCPPLQSPLSTWVEWCQSTIPTCLRRVSELRRANTPDSEREAVKVNSLLTKLERVVTESAKVEWVAEPGKFSALLTPVWGGPYTEQYLFRSIPSCLVCSATLSKQTALHLAIPTAEYDFFEVDSTFDASRRPLIYYPCSPPVRVDHRMSEGETKLWVNRIDAIISSEPGKGIVHTLSYSRAMDILHRSRHSSIMITHGSGETRRAVDTFKSACAPAVLVSPSVEEGVDFPYDLCSYQLLPKVPFVDTRGPLLSTRCKQDPNYSIHLTSQRMVQMVGRGMRAADDECRTYVIDSHWQWVQGKGDFPRWFRESFQTKR